jgi:uncharacterized protein with ParB-like and HNH nuclease domain
MSGTFKTLQNYLYQQGKTFVVPNYQRGYKWAVKEGDGSSAVEKLMDDLIKTYKSPNHANNYFMQGITVSEEDNNIILIDGQQRTTTLYLLLRCIGRSNIEAIDLQYDIRKDSKEYICKLKEAGFNYYDYEQSDSVQDIFYFKKAIQQIENKLENDVD